MDSSIPVATEPASSLASSPVMDVMPPQAEEKAASKTESATAEAKKPALPKTAKQPNKGVGAAIFATTVIVLALSAMATYAYIKTK